MPAPSQISIVAKTRRATLGALLALAFVAVPDASAQASCGATIFKADGTPWQCTFADEFSGSTLDTSKWVAQQTATSGYTNGRTACFVNSPNNISVASGVLRLTARREQQAFTCRDPWGHFRTRYTSGMVSTFGRFSQAFGRFEIRAKVVSTPIPGLHEAIWLWPENPSLFGWWPTSGEIDIAEMYSRYPDRAVPYVHYTTVNDPNVTNHHCMLDLSAFHTYVVEWNTQTITISYDGKTCLVNNWQPVIPLLKPQPFDQPFLVVLTQALGVGDNAFQPGVTPLPATMQVDYVRVWA